MGKRLVGKGTAIAYADREGTVHEIEADSKGYIDPPDEQAAAVLDSLGWFDPDNPQPGPATPVVESEEPEPAEGEDVDSEPEPDAESEDEPGAGEQE